MSIGKNKQIEHTKAYQCYEWFQLFAVKKRFASHLIVCLSMLDMLYKFENQNLVTFEDDLKYLGDLWFVGYFDWETTTSSGSQNSLDIEEMYQVSYGLIFAFKPKLDIDRIVILRSFQHTSDQLNDISYLKCEMIDELDPVALNQLRDYALNVYEKNPGKFAMSEIFSLELKFASDCIKRWLK